MTAGPGPSSAPHHDVASYALGVLGDDEATRFEEHLAECEICARELESFLPVVDLLPDVQLSTVDLPPRPVDPAPDELGRRRARRRTSEGSDAERLVLAARSAVRRPLVAAAVAAIAAAGVTAGVMNEFGHEQINERTTAATSSTAPWDQMGGPDLTGGRSLSASDPGSGTHADVVLNTAPWGTRVSFALSRVTGPQTCRLVAQRRNGDTEVLSTWVVPSDGYGTSAHRDPLVLQAATSTPTSDIVGLRVESLGSSGVHNLVSIPV